MADRTRQLLERHAHLQRAESDSAVLSKLLRQQPDQDRLREAWRLANRQVLQARRALLECAVETTPFAGTAAFNKPRTPVHGARADAAAAAD